MTMEQVEPLFYQALRVTGDNKTAAAVLTLAAIIARQPPALGIPALLPPNPPEPLAQAVDLTPAVTWEAKCPTGKWPAAEVPS